MLGPRIMRISLLSSPMAALEIARDKVGIGGRQKKV